MSDKLMICVRCHNYANFVIDMIDSIKHHATTDPYIMIAVDNRDMYNIVNNILRTHQNIGVYVSPTRCGWGSGLYKLLVDSLKWAKQHYIFDHFCVMDYDTIFIKEGADQMMLSEIDDDTGLLGAVQSPHQSWRHAITKHWNTLSKYLSMPESYKKGKGVLGALMVLTDKNIDRFISNGYLEEPYRSVLKLKLPDDIWVSLLTYTTGLQIKNLGSYTPEKTDKSINRKVAITWKVPTPIKVAIDNGAYVYHPVKMASGGKFMNNDDILREREARRKFREYRR